MNRYVLSSLLVVAVGGLGLLTWGKDGSAALLAFLALALVMWRLDTIDRKIDRL